MDKFYFRDKIFLLCVDVGLAFSLLQQQKEILWYVTRYLFVMGMIIWILINLNTRKREMPVYKMAGVMSLWRVIL